jgi:hypothetical protein
MDPLTVRERSLLFSDGIYASRTIFLMVAGSILWGTLLRVDVFPLRILMSIRRQSGFVFVLILLHDVCDSMKKSAYILTLITSQRKNKSRSWAALIAAVGITCGTSTYAWVLAWAQIFCQNGFYFDSTETNLAIRQAEGRLVTTTLSYTENTLFGVQVSNK